jgi:hypothetical protein
MRKSAMVFVLMSAVAAQAVNTTVTLSDKSWVPSQQTLVGQVGPSSGRAPAASEQAMDSQESSDGSVLPTLYVYPELSSLQLANPAESLGSGGSNANEQPAIRLIDGIGGTADLPNEPNGLADAGFVSAGRRENLPTLAEIDWTTTVLPTAKEVSVMEIVVFPALGALVVAFIAGMLIARLRRRRPIDQAQQLLRA